MISTNGNCDILFFCLREQKKNTFRAKAMGSNHFCSNRRWNHVYNEGNTLLTVICWQLVSNDDDEITVKESPS